MNTLPKRKNLASNVSGADLSDFTSPEIRRRLFRTALRHNLSSFIQKSFQTVVPGDVYVPNWHIDAIAYALERCERREIRRLIISIPPRTAKSIATSVAFPAWLLGLHPEARVIVASYSQDFSDKHARDCRALIDAPWYREIFPRTRIERDATSDFTTKQRGYRLATSVLGQLTGRGGQFIIIDDPQKPQDVHSRERREAVCDWMASTVSSRLDNQVNDVIILVQQRLHEGDLSGHLLEQGDWHHLNLPAIAENTERIAIDPQRYVLREPGDLLDPVRLSREALDDLKIRMGSAAFAAQYQQNPIPAEGNVVKWDWFKTYDVPPEPRPGDRIIQSWDTASKAEEINDWSVCITLLLRGEDIFVLHVDRDRLEFPALRRRVQAMAKRDHTDILLIEQKGSGIQLIQSLRDEDCPRPIPIMPDVDKLTRMHVQTPPIEAGRVYIPKVASWLEDFKHELLAFPGGRHDDQVDAFSQALAWIDQKNRHRWKFS